MYDYDYDYDDRDYDYDGPDFDYESAPNDAAYNEAMDELVSALIDSGEFASVYWRLVAEGRWDDTPDMPACDIIHELVTEEIVDSWFERYEERAQELADWDGESFDANYGDPCGCSSPYCPCSGPGKYRPL